MPKILPKILQRTSDFLVIGSGISGLSYALKVASFGKVHLITKDCLQESATTYAQGGIACVFDSTDSFENHIADTLKAGDGLCDPSIVKLCVEEGPARMRELIAHEVPFTLQDSKPHLHKEGGHSQRRIFHVQDQTGRSVQNILIQKVKEHPNIKIFEFHQAIDLITTHKFLNPLVQNQCWGAYVLDVRENHITSFLSPITLLATGGCGKVYLYTTNPDVATGDGIAMAYRAGVPIVNLEFFQFHPTCLYHPKAKSFLISEAVRGEGGILIRKDGTPFMNAYDPKGSLATRDIVARAIDHELKKTGDDHVALDISHKSPQFIQEHFPTIYQKCLSFGIDIAHEPIPVVPAAHYQCGGVATDIHGQTSLPGLYAIGEVAWTGLHGANRLASNSLLEGLVFAHRAALHSAQHRLKLSIPTIPQWECGKAKMAREQVVISHLWDEIRRCMWNHVGIVRSNQRLERAFLRMKELQKEISSYYWEFTLNKDLIEVRNIALVAQLIIECAQKRKESRGLHTNIDFPMKKGMTQNTLLMPDQSHSLTPHQYFA